MASNAKKAEQALAGNNLIIVLVLVSLVVVGATGLIAKSMAGRIARDAKVLAAKDKADGQLQKNVENAPGLVDSYKSLGPLLTIIDHALPTNTDFPGLLTTYENLALTSNVVLKAVTPTAVSATGSTALVAPTTPVEGATSESSVIKPTPKKYQFSVSFDASYVSLQQFMKNIELSARPMRVVNLKLTGAGTLLTGQMVVETFYQDKAVLPIGSEFIK